MALRLKAMTIKLSKVELFCQINAAMEQEIKAKLAKVKITLLSHGNKLELW